METTQAQALAEPQKRPLKARTTETYWGKSHIECYHFYQQCEDHFETSGATGINHTPFASSFLRGSISLRWAQHKRRHESATPIMWSEFKVFLRKDLGSSQAFIDNIWSKFRRDSQYQLEEAQDWASYLQHLQSILSEFDPIRTPNKLTMICYFREGLKPSIKVEMEQQDRESMDFKEMVQRAVNAESKAGLRSSAMVRDSDICYPQGHRLSNSTASKVQTQGITAKDSQQEKPEVKEVKPTLSRAAEASKPSEQACKEKKGKIHPERWDKKEQTPASTANATEVQQKKKKKNRDRDVSEVTCYNCNKKGHYPNTCIELKN